MSFKSFSSGRDTCGILKECVKKNLNQRCSNGEKWHFWVFHYLEFHWHCLKYLETVAALVTHFWSYCQSTAVVSMCKTLYPPWLLALYLWVCCWWYLKMLKLNWRGWYGEKLFFSLIQIPILIEHDLYLLSICMYFAFQRQNANSCHDKRPYSPHLERKYIHFF